MIWLNFLPNIKFDNLCHQMFWKSTHNSFISGVPPYGALSLAAFSLMFCRSSLGFF